MVRVSENYFESMYGIKSLNGKLKRTLQISSKGWNEQSVEETASKVPKTLALARVFGQIVAEGTGYEP